MGRKQHRRSQQEIDQIRRERAQRKTQDVEVQMGAMTLEFHDDLRLTVEEDWHCENGDAIAGLQWAGGVRLARFFDDRSVFSEDYWKNKEVLELGAGQGLTSCVLATLGCKRVVCSDADITHALQTVERNADVLTEPPDVVAYSWGVGAPPIVADVIVCGDCLYNKDHAHLLVRGLLDCASSSTSVYLCGAVGEDAYRAFLAEAPRFFDVEVLDGSAQTGITVNTWQKRDLLRLTRRAPGPSLQAIQPGRKDKLVGDDAALFDDVSDGDTCIECEDFTERARTLVDPYPDHRSVFVVDGVLDGDACQRLIAASSSRDSFWAGDDPHEDARPFRDADTCEVSCPKLAARIYERIAPYLSETPIAIPSTEHLETRGAWRPCALNEDFLFGNYQAKGGFAPHSDGATAKGLNLRSFYSVIIYLNTPSEGGGTRFYKKSATDVVLENNRWTGRKDLAVFEVQPLIGRALVFDQRLVHEGIPPSDRKHIIRTDIMYERIEPLFVEFSAEYADYERAVDLSERGQHADAVKLFRKVSRRAPELAGELGI